MVNDSFNYPFRKSLRERTLSFLTNQNLFAPLERAMSLSRPVIYCLFIIIATKIQEMQLDERYGQLDVATRMMFKVV